MPRARTRHRSRRARPRVTLDQLHTFLAVADTEHVTAAAAALQQSQGSVSATISRLEDALGLPLLQRVGRNVRLTDVGTALGHLAVQVFDDVAQIEELTRGYLAFERGTVTVACGRVAGAHQAPRWLAPFVAAHPAIDVRITLASLRAVLEMLRDGSADVVMVSAPVRIDGVDTLVLERAELVVVVAAQHPLAGSHRPMRELSRHRYLAHESGTGTRAHAARLVGEPLRELAVIELEEGALLAALLAGIGFGVMPRTTVDAEIRAGRLVVLPHAGRPVTQPVTAARRRAIHPPAVDSLWEHLRGVAAQR